MQNSFARARTRPKGQARATIGYLVYKSKGILHTIIKGSLNADKIHFVYECDRLC